MKQRTNEWYQARLGWFTSSNIYKLLSTGRKKDEVFSETAMKYIYQVAAERTLSEKFKSGQGFEMYLERMNSTSNTMRWGNDIESVAREEYTNETGNQVIEIGFIRSSLFGDSPDGIVSCDENGQKGVIEIKCPTPAIHKIYTCISKPEELKKLKPEYYIQCQCHIMANYASWCDFISYDPMQFKAIHIIRIKPDKEMQIKIIERLDLAEKEVKRINNN